MKVLIVGGVAGGAGAAARLRRDDENCEIIMFEKSGFISFANCGLPYYIGDVITDRKDLLVQTPESFSKRFRVDVRILNEVTAVNVKEKTVTVKDLKENKTYVENYDKLILSPGSSPIVPKIKGATNENVFTLRNVEDTLKIKSFIIENKPKTAAVIGGGYIGLEMADNLIKDGIDTSIIEAQSHVMSSFDKDMSSDIHNHIRSKGVKLVLNSFAVEFNDSGVLTDKGENIPADLIILSVGVHPTTEFLKDSGIKLGDKDEIIVNEKLETSEKDIYAVGDAISVENYVLGKKALIPLASPANKQARIVADNICSKGMTYNGTQGTAIAKVFDMTVAVTGLTEETLIKNQIQYKKVYTFSPSHAKYYPGANSMFVKLMFSPDEGKVLGAEITGYEGVDKRIDVLATVLRLGGTVYDLEELELAYAPPFSSAKDPVNMAGYVAENVLSEKATMFYPENINDIPKDAILLDVRTKGEYEKGTINDAINIPLDELRDRLSELPKEKTIYEFCQVGLRGYIAEQILKGHGFKVLNLSGGYRFFSALSKDK